MKKTFIIFSIALIYLTFSPSSALATNFTTTMPGTQSITMGDARDTLTFRITNTHATQSINRVTFNFSAALYYIEWDTVAPTGWTTPSIPGATNTIQFNSSAVGNNIPPGGFLDFSIIVSGPNWTNFVASNNDVTTDTLTSISARFSGSVGTHTHNAGALIPTWTRRSLAVTIVGYPDAVGIGQSFVVEMQVENRSTNPKNNISATPSPPTPTFGGGAAITNTGGPVYNPNPLNLAAGAQGTITYTYRADAQGTVYFTASVTTANATSKTATSNIIAINPLTASLSVSPTSAVSGQTVVVTMTVSSTGLVTTLSSAIDSAVQTIPVASTAAFPATGSVIIDSEEIAYTGINATNLTGCTRGINGTTAASHNASAVVRNKISLGNIVPSTLTNIGTATATLVSGPTPATISSISTGQSGTFQWVYQITGTLGQTYQFQGSATADGPTTSNTATSEMGVLDRYSITTDPSSIPTGSTNVTISFTIYSNASTINLINFNFPDSTWVGWYQNTTFSCSDGNSNWTTTTRTFGTVYTAVGNSSIAAGQSCTFNISFSQVPAVTNDTTKIFYPDLYYTGPTFAATLLGIVTITAYNLSITHTPAGPIDADGTGAYTITATLTRISDGLPLANRTVIFNSTAGTLSSSTAITNAAGQAVVTLTAPVSTTDITATVTATYIKTKDTHSVDFRGVNAPNLQYVGGTLSPLSVCKGQTYTFLLNVRNYGTANMNLTSASYFRFTDGTNIFTAYLDSPTTVNVGSTVLLTFGSQTSAGGGGGVTLSSSFASGSYAPTLYLTGTCPVLSCNQTRNVSDNVNVPVSCSGGSGGGKIKIIKWREVVQ